MSNGNGVIYVAFGKPYLAMAAVSAASVKAVSPDVGVAVVTNVAPAPEELSEFPFDHWIYEDAPTKVNRNYKISIDQYTPFDKTVFMDCDTVAVDDISDLFKYLDNFDLAMQITGLLVGYKHAQVEVMDGLKIGSLPHWNSGIIAFADRPQVHDFFAKWRTSFQRLGLSSDQPACVEAVFTSEARHLSFDHRWNSPVAAFLRARGTEGESKFRIVHYTLNIVTPDIEKYLLRADRLLVEQAGLPDDKAVQQFIDAKHAKRSRTAEQWASQELLSQELTL